MLNKGFPADLGQTTSPVTLTSISTVSPGGYSCVFSYEIREGAEIFVLSDFFFLSTQATAVAVGIMFTGFRQAYFPL